MYKKIVATALLCTSLFVSTLSTNAAPNEYLPHDLLYENDFESGVGIPWHVVENIPAKCKFDISGGKFNIEIINKGKEIWDIQFRHKGFKIQAGHNYTVKFSVEASNDCSIYPKIGDSKAPFFEDWNYNNRSWSLMNLRANVKHNVKENFTATRTCEVSEFAFHLSDKSVPVGTVFSFDDIYLEDKQITKPGYPMLPAPRLIRTNHLGYFVKGEKKATFPCKSTKPVEWTLEDSYGKMVVNGKTIPFGNDPDSGNPVHIIDFSTFEASGTGYILRAGLSDVLVDDDGTKNENFSFPFDISNDIYHDLKYDALKYFYHQRSGIDIEMPYAQKNQWCRPAGHPADYVTFVSENDSSNNYSLDVTGGWYAANATDKDTMSNALSLWTLLNMYEHKVQYGNIYSLEDSILDIPESDNGISDIIDEAKWGMDFLLKMQIPQGLPNAGMVHHKVKDTSTSILGRAPHECEDSHVLLPPSTAATLGFAATAAHTYRVWKHIDTNYANKCLLQGELAWKAAVLNPDMPVPEEMEQPGWSKNSNFSDEFYWAAAELFISTGKSEYFDYIKNSKHYLEMPTILSGDKTGSFDIQNTQGLGTISLALKGYESLPSADFEKARMNIIKAADTFIEIQDNQGYGITIKQAPIKSDLKGYPFPSNSFVLNQCIVLGYAYDFSTNEKYSNGMMEAMDYILGRNPNSKSYVSGYGEYCLENPHHSFFACEADPNYPICPPGLIASGPNSGMEDNWIRSAGMIPGAVPPQKCYIDNIESWSTNMVSIDWNASLAWVAVHLDNYFGTNPEYPKSTPYSNPTLTPIPTPTFTPTPTPTFTSTVTSKKGDIDSDGLINSTDYAIIKRITLGIKVDADKDAADINNDDTIDSLDVALLKRHLLGISLIK